MYCDSINDIHVYMYLFLSFSSIPQDSLKSYRTSNCCILVEKGVVVTGVHGLSPLPTRSIGMIIGEIQM
jgi:hypothetical protein